MPPKETTDLILKKPISVLNCAINLDFKEFFTALAKLGVSGVMLDTKGASKSSIDLLKSLSIKEEPEQVAWLLISRSLMNALEILVTDYQDLFNSNIDEQALTDLAERVEYTMGIIKVGLDASFFKNPKNLPLLDEIKSALCFWLSNLGMNTHQADAFLYRLKSQFVIVLHKEWGEHPSAYKSILQSLETPFTQASLHERQRVRYNLWLHEQANQRVFNEAFALRRVYIKLRAYYEIKHENTDNEFTAFDLHKEIESWVQKFDSENALRIICGGPGCGKSSFSKILAADLAEKDTVPILFIPLHHFNIGDDLIEGVEKFIAREPYLSKNPMDVKDGENRLLVIFDGLDELSMQGNTSNDAAQNFIDEVVRTFSRQNASGKKWQALITGRDISVQAIEDRLRKVGQILHILPYVLDKEEIKKYKGNAKLLALDQRQEWWKKFGQAKGKRDHSLPGELTADNLIPITREPLLNYLIALSYERQKIQFNEDTSLNEIYYDLLRAVHERQYESAGNVNVKHLHFNDFLIVLEEVALAVWHSNGRTASESYILERCKENGLTKHLESFSEGAKKGVTRLLTAFYFRQFGIENGGDKTFEFTHKSFGEYLAARRIVGAAKTVFEEMSRHKQSSRNGWSQQQALLEWIKICGPTSIDDYVAKFIYQEIKEHNDKNSYDWQSVFAQLIKVAIIENLPMELSSVNAFSEMITQNRNATESLFIIHSALGQLTKKIVKSELSEPFLIAEFLQSSLMRSSVIHRTLNDLNFSSTSFSRLGLRGADFSRSIFLNGLFSNCDISAAGLKEVDLSLCNFIDIKFRASNFEKAKMSHVYGQDIDFTNANMSKTNMDASEFVNSTFNFANLNNANLRGASFMSCQFVSTDLENADLTDADLSNANLTNARLSGATFKRTNLTNAILGGATFDDAIFKDVTSVEKDLKT